MILLTN